MLYIEYQQARLDVAVEELVTSQGITASRPRELNSFNTGLIATANMHFLTA
jgi:hypothetical protein